MHAHLCVFIHVYANVLNSYWPIMQYIVLGLMYYITAGLMYCINVGLMFYIHNILNLDTCNVHLIYRYD